MTLLTATALEICPMTRSDLQQVVGIENRNSSFSSPLTGAWTTEDFMEVLRKPNNKGIVAVQNDTVLGFAVYSLLPGKIYICNLSVDTDCVRTKIGTQLITKLKSKLVPKRRDILEIDVRESNLTAQLFLRKMNFRAVQVIRNWYEQPIKEDAYKFRLEI